MGYLKDDRFRDAMLSMEKGLFEAMCLLEAENGYINTWGFDDSGKINLFQDMNCGCKRFLNKIDIGLKEEDIKNNILENEEFLGQIEDLLLEVNYKHDLENFLFNEKDILSLKQSCDICDK